MTVFKRLLVLTLVLSGCSEAESPKNSTTYENDVERIINTLAADDMRGRQAFSEDAWVAARFIASEFEAIGLKVFADNEDYLQAFPIYETRTESLNVSLDGAQVAPEQMAGSISADELSWNRDSDITRVFVGPDDDLATVWRQYRRSGNTLIGVHSSHADMFERYQGFMSRPSRATELSSEANLVMVLTDSHDLSGVRVEATAEVSTSEITNVVGVIPGNRADEIVVFSGHYDHIGFREGEEDPIFNGANDNASGTTATIQLARYFKSLGTPERTLMFVGFTAEESGGYGSRHFSKQLDPSQIVAMFNIEMIGKPAVEGPNTAWITGFDRSDFGTILQEAVEGTVFAFYPDPYPTQNLFYRSDNATLARLGVPAHTISTTPIDVDEDYHQASDEVSTLDLDHLSNTIDAIAAGAALIVNGERTPTRIDPALVN
ncbi:MAG: M28 family peptidase [Bacteroidetes Order II. Incertae sedis bacterium]|jgi:hypothetical protein|nr:M28 family peptidase [Bacteroidetes Order II. bacterium]MBT4053419.1 M28 family peptidase [Bacteroidetes Order II. bacterium]MBT4603198.1 M28 family peptidase [Bacteroidetes Order II. bacterium]MBT5249546.1 M28 family peptidase [Bacteroidetes Order II. bacterium]MBT6199892.1 M28 family peptidase [Bacteroidetes Order II. bacterium]